MEIIQLLLIPKHDTSVQKAMAIHTIHPALMVGACLR